MKKPRDKRARTQSRADRAANAARTAAIFHAQARELGQPPERPTPQNGAEGFTVEPAKPPGYCPPLHPLAAQLDAAAAQLDAEAARLDAAEAARPRGLAGLFRRLLGRGHP